MLIAAGLCPRNTSEPGRLRLFFTATPPQKPSFDPNTSRRQSTAGPNGNLKTLHTTCASIIK